ncbi:unnamed protein product [Candidula unifasciata]|uniref:Fibrinogen C-terminal domain-containing protein n=1 Tax=Candidula unifasciata TaxID=100452 RepID=A0A8S3YIN0_9EUPU|nr:unnamed protein product [Candidula unifasciata]
MSLQAVLLSVRLLLTFVTVCQGLELTIDRTPGSQFCAQLVCDQTVSQTDKHISYLIGLSIYNLTMESSRLKFASISVFDPDLYIDQSKVEVINGTGSITRSQGRLELSFKDAADCLQGSFVCELDFMNVSGQLDSLIKNITPRDNSSCTLLEYQLRVLEGKVTLLIENNRALQSSLEHVVQRLDLLEPQVNSSLNKPQLVCSKGFSYSKARQEFLLWGHIPALCDTVTDGGGWVIIQRRTKGDVDFNRTWVEYKNGFGTPDTDFWIGLDVIHNLTSQGFNELRVDLGTQLGTQLYAHYSIFSVANESMNYRLSVDSLSGSASDGLTLFHNNMNFSTYDRDSDGTSAICAELSKGAWWFHVEYCWYTNLNGQWGLPNYGMSWYTADSRAFLNFTEMKLRRH